MTRLNSKRHNFQPSQEIYMKDSCRKCPEVSIPIYSLSLTPTLVKVQRANQWVGDAQWYINRILAPQRHIWDEGLTTHKELGDSGLSQPLQLWSAAMNVAERIHLIQICFHHSFHHDSDMIKDQLQIFSKGQLSVRKLMQMPTANWCCCS